MHHSPVKQQQFLSQYIFGAVCPSQKTCAAVILPAVNVYGLEAHLKEISCHVKKGKHALLPMDQAGWHTSKALKVPDNILALVR